MTIKKAILCFLLMAIILSATVACGNTDVDLKLEEEIYTVESGDSLWYIATIYCPDSIEMQEYIYMVRARNGLQGTTIYPGQRLIVFVE